MCDSNSPAESLWQNIISTSQRALEGGHLPPLETEKIIAKDHNYNFVIHLAKHLAAKPPASAVTNSNPFLPYAQALFVDSIGAHHVGLLNKFNVVDGHLLIVTRDFQPQETRLNRDDFQALAVGLSAFESLGFYNSCAVAGASQPHRHLQLVPYSTAAFPLVGVADLPFAHCRRTIAQQTSLGDLSRALHDAYESMIDELGWQEVHADTPYNLLATRQSIVLIPRQNEYCGEHISLNALAFAGSFFVQQRQQLDRLVAMGPIQALIHCAGPMCESDRTRN